MAMGICSEVNSIFAMVPRLCNFPVVQDESPHFCPSDIVDGGVQDGVVYDNDVEPDALVIPPS